MFRLNKIVISILILIGISFSVFGLSWHYASQILPGTFSTGDFAFNGGINITAGNDICILGGNCLSNVSMNALQNKTSMIPDWPDAIVCTWTSDHKIVLYNNFIPQTQGSLAYYRSVDSDNYGDSGGATVKGALFGIRFNFDGTYNSIDPQITTQLSDCKNKNITQLYANNQAFNFIGGSGGGSGTGGESLPTGTVMTFNLSSCPIGWSEYTPAYGRFIRGIDKSGNSIDPDGQRALGNIQNYQISNHIHGKYTGSGGYGYGLTNPIYSPYTNLPISITTETRPKNAALLYCIKTSQTSSGSGILSKNSNNVYLTDSNDNFGVGTSTPTTKLVINGTTKTTGSVAGYQFEDRGGGPGFQWYSSANVARLYDQSTGVDRMVIDSAGNVGIGTTTPTAKLEVNGLIKADNVGAAAYVSVSATAASTLTGTTTTTSAKQYATCPVGYSIVTWALTENNACTGCNTYHYCNVGKQDSTRAFVTILDDNSNANYRCRVTAFCIKD